MCYGSRMNRNPLSAAAALSAVAATILVIIYRERIWHALLALAAMRLAWVVMRAKLGIRKQAKSGKSLWEVGFATLAGYLFGARRHGFHGCGKCGAPIQAPSRAIYCSPACRNYAALERAHTERSAERLAAFGDVPEGFGA